MSIFKPFLVMAAAVFAFTACQPPANTTAVNSSNAVNASDVNAAKAAAAPPTKEAIVALEDQTWQAWKNKDGKFYDDILSDKYVGFTKTGRTNKAETVKGTAESKCDVKSYSFSDEQLNMLGSDVAVLTFKAAQDYTCEGKKGPASVWSASAYVREGDKWKGVLYAEMPVVDPNAPPAKSTAAPKAAKPADAAKPDALTTDLMAVETRAWDAWKSRDAKATEAEMAKDFLYLSGTGRYDRAGSIKAWSEPKCEGLDYAFSEPSAVSLSPDVAFVTYKADVKGTCNGKPNQPSLWVASFDLKEGNAWKNAVYIDMER
jgi:hypothetical protein